MFKILIISFILITALLGKQTYGNVTVNEVTSIYDGDTFRVNIKSYPGIIGEKMAVRINGIDTPEIKGKCKKEIDFARAAKQFTVTALRNAKNIELRNMQRGKYFRIAADVYVDNISLGELLIKKNLAVPYDGGTKTKNWCE